MGEPEFLTRKNAFEQPEITFVKALHPIDSVSAVFHKDYICSAGHKWLCFFVEFPPVQGNPEGRSVWFLREDGHTEVTTSQRSVTLKGKRDEASAASHLNVPSLDSPDVLWDEE